MISNLGLSEGEQEALEARGVDLSRMDYLGSGKNRSAYESRVVRGTRLYPVTITIPNQNPDSMTPNAVINRGKGDLDANEVQMLNSVGNYVGLGVNAESVEGDSRTINIIPFPSSTDLEKLVQNFGPRRERQEVQHIIGGLLRHLESAASKGVLHRDIKPDNVFIDYNNGIPEGSLGDFQLASKVDDLRDSPLPTRGTGTYAHPRLLNAWATGEAAKTSERTEIHSFGKTLYYMFTGETPSNYSIVEQEDGRGIEANGRKFRVGLVKKTEQGQESIERIDERENERDVRSMSKQVPKWARSFVYRCLTDKPGKSFNTFREARKYFDKISAREYESEQRKDVRTFGKIAAFAASVIIGLGMLSGPDKEMLKAYESNPDAFFDIGREFPTRDIYSTHDRLFDMGRNYLDSRMSRPISGEEAR